MEWFLLYNMDRVTGPGGKAVVRMVEQAILINLEDAGCGRDVVDRYCELEAQQRSIAMIRQDQIQLLCRQRKELLNDLHRCQKRIDCLDYLIYQMKEQLRTGET